MLEKTNVKVLDKVVVRFSGDSGDGMQLAGNIFTNVSAGVGNQVSTFPDYPAEIRAPQGSLSGVSGFQVSVGKGVHTPGDRCDVLIAMNPGDGEETCPLDRAYTPIFTMGAPIAAGDTLRLPPQSFAVLKPDEEAAPGHSDR